MENIKIKSGITRIGIGARLKPECENIESSSLSSRTCEFCGKTFSSSTRRFCSSFCAHAYSSSFSAKNASKRNKEKLGIKCKCDFCNQNFDSKSDLKKHLKGCSKKVKKVKKPLGTWKCSSCNTIFVTRKLLYEHYKLCEERKKLPLDSKGRIIPDYDRSLACEKAYKTKVKNGTLSHSMPESAKKKLSEARRTNLENGIGNHWINPSIKRSYAEQYFYDCFTNAGLQFENNVWVGHYCLDFKVGNNYFEVNGEQHYMDEGLAKDKRRTEFLKKKGFTLVGRCRWKEFKKLSFNEKEKYINSIIRLLKNL